MKSLFVTCSQGIEDLLIDELNSLGYPETKKGFRGIYVDVPDFNAICHINYCSRLAGRVLLPLLGFKCYDQKSLYHCASNIDWLPLIPPHKTFAIDANVNHKNLRNSLFAAQIVKDAICDQIREKTGERPNVNPKEPDIQLNLFIHGEDAVISFDTSGAPLYKRGYRQESTEAPMQEALAAAILKIAKYDPTNDILYDPCCGSGTILIEAAYLATHTAPGFLRTTWGFQEHPDYSESTFKAMKAEIDSKRVPLKGGLIFGTEVNKNNLRICKLNLRIANVLSSIEVIQSDFRAFEPPKPPTLIITNPPYGLRLDEESMLIPLYRALGDFMKNKTAKPARGFIFTGSPLLAKEVGLAAKRRYPMSNSGIECRLLEFDLY